MWTVVTVQCFVPAGGCIWGSVRSYKANCLCELVMSEADTQNVKTDTTGLEN